MSRSCNCYDCLPGKIARREIRHSKDGPEELPAKGPRKKTRKWCKGKIGVNHVWERQKPYDWTDLKVDVCINCGKHGRYHW